LTLFEAEPSMCWLATRRIEQEKTWNPRIQSAPIAYVLNRSMLIRRDLEPDGSPSPETGYQFATVLKNTRSLNRSNQFSGPGHHGKGGHAVVRHTLREM
jgi:hypothetical protein